MILRLLEGLRVLLVVEGRMEHRLWWLVNGSHIDWVHIEDVNAIALRRLFESGGSLLNGEGRRLTHLLVAGHLEHLLDYKVLLLYRT